MPAFCPACRAPSAVTAEAHCKKLACWWLRCRCGATFNELGQFFLPPRVPPYRLGGQS